MQHRSTIAGVVCGVVLALASGVVQAAPPAAPSAPRWAIALHGGAGTIARKDLDPETEAT